MTNQIEEALKSAIEALNDCHRDGGIRYEAATNLCTSALAELEKCEPVAYMYEYPSNVEGWTTRTLSVSLEPDLHHLVKVTPLYTSPQPRDWVSLTDEQRNYIRYHHPTDLVNATEAKLKQLNTKG